MSKYSHNDSFFLDEINSYYAGFIAADGSITQDNTTFRMELAIKDKEILESLTKNLNYNKNIEILSKKCHQFTNKKKNYCRFSIYSKKLVKQLKDIYNITSNKSLTLKPPNITNFEQKLRYIIGYIDGDGHIGIRKRKYIYLVLDICGTKEMLEWVCDILYKLSNIKLIIKKRKNTNIYHIRGEGNKVYTILKKLNQIQVPFKLERKWNKIKEYELLKGIK